MHTDGYGPAIPLEELLRLSHVYGPPALAGKQLPSDHTETSRTVEQQLCPCVRGEPCVVEALAVEFERLAAMFRRHKIEVQSKSCPDCEERWSNEGGQVLHWQSGANPRVAT